jgi:hypothetical protein
MNGTGARSCDEVAVKPALTPSTATTPGTRYLLPGMRVLLAAFAVLTATAFIALYLLARTTDVTFAWTIDPPLTAAFLGAGYGAGCVLVVLSLRDPVWAHSRLAVVTIFVFTVLTLVATLLHVNRMHFDDDFSSLGLVAKLAAWFWLAVYVVIPAAMAVLLVLQERVPGTDPPSRHPIPAVLRGALALESAVLLLYGAFLFADPTRATSFWPWTLTPFTARVVASWLIAFGLATAMAALGGDLRQLRSAAIAYTVFGVLVLAALLRFPGSVAWGEPQAWILLACAAGVVATGAAGWRAAPAVASDD